MGKEKGWALLKDLDKNVAQYTPSGSRPCKMARAGEYAIGVSFAFPAMQSIEEGFPIKMVIPSKWVGYELEASGLMKTAKNPTDAKRFLDWTLSAQAGDLYSKYKELVTIPGATPNKAAEAAGLPKDLTAVLYPVDFPQVRHGSGTRPSRPGRTPSSVDGPAAGQAGRRLSWRRHVSGIARNPQDFRCVGSAARHRPVRGRT
jgi:ABC-type Fe3+ transport system substrate-binding protein